MAVKVKQLAVCPACSYRQKSEAKICKKCGDSLKNADRSWWVFIDHAGRKKAKKIGTRDAAMKVAAKLEARLTLGDFHILEKKTEAMTFTDYADKWLSTYAQNSLKYSTWKRYGNLLKTHIYPAIGKVPLDGIERTMLKNFIFQKVEQGLARATIRQMNALVSSIFTHAVEDALVKANPASKMGKFYKDTRGKEEIHPFTREELSLLLDTVQEHFAPYYPVFLTLARTGMRLGEALGLNWGDIDFSGRFIHVQRNYTHNRLTTPKSGKTRKVDMSTRLTEVLSAHRTAMKEKALKRGWGEVPEAAFVNEEGGRLDAGNLRGRVFYKAQEKAGLSRRRIHDLRHCYASLLLMAGESLVYVKEQLGHASIQITVDIYGHWIPGSNKAAVDRLDGNQTKPIRNLEIEKGYTKSVTP